MANILQVEGMFPPLLTRSPYMFGLPMMACLRPEQDGCKSTGMFKLNILWSPWRIFPNRVLMWLQDAPLLGSG